MQTWSYDLTVPAGPIQNLTNLLRRTWLIPKSVYHYLRVGQRILLNGRYQSVNTLAQPGDHIHLIFQPEDFRTPAPQFLLGDAQRLKILYENQDLIVLDKPAGQKTHANQPWEDDCLLNDLMAYYADTATLPYIVHRLDKATSGAIVVAKNPVMLPLLSRTIKMKQTARHYLAWIHGQLPATQGWLTTPIGRDPDDKRKRMANGVNALPADTFYQVQRQTAHTSLVALTLTTGRTHQIRVHLAAAGHPILGDPLYDPDYRDDPRLFLHAHTLKISVPFYQHTLGIVCPPSQQFWHPNTR